MGPIQIPDEALDLLAEIWQHLGLNDEQSKQALDGLKTDLSDLVLKFIEGQQQRVEDTKSKIETARQLISKMSKALGEEEPPRINDQPTLLQQFNLLHERLSSIEKRVAAMTDMMQKKLTELKSIYQQLDVDVAEEFQEVGDTDLTQSRLSYIEAALEQARQERNLRQAKMAKLLSAANQLARQLEEPAVKIDGIRPEDLTAAEDKLHVLQNTMAEKSQRLDEVRALVQKRWTDLRKDDKYISYFTNCLTGTISTDLRLTENELGRLNQQYAMELPRLIEACSERIGTLRRELRQESVSVQSSSKQPPCEAILHDLEKEEVTLKAELEVMRPILQQISKWEKLRVELLEGLEEASTYANDPNRFHGRQAFKMLKKEEDLRRLESKTLPRLQEKLLSLIQGWERENNRTLMIDGNAFLATLKELSNNGKENSLATPNASPAVARTPSQTPGLVRRASLNATSKKVAATPDSVPRPRRLRVSGVSEIRRSSPSMQDRLARVLEQAEAALKVPSNGCSQDVLPSISQAIQDLEAADPSLRMKHADALSDLYHKRAVIYTHLGDYDSSIRDSEAAQAALSWGRNGIN